MKTHKVWADISLCGLPLEHVHYTEYTAEVTCDRCLASLSTKHTVPAPCSVCFGKLTHKEWCTNFNE